MNLADLPLADQSLVSGMLGAGVALMHAGPAAGYAFAIEATAADEASAARVEAALLAGHAMRVPARFIERHVSRSGATVRLGVRFASSAQIVAGLR